MAISTRAGRSRMPSLIRATATRPPRLDLMLLIAPKRGPFHHGMLAYMRRTTIKIPDDLDARLRHEAARSGSTISDVTRAALEAHLGGGGRRRLGAAGAGRSGRADVSERIEEIIRSEVGSSR